MTIERPVFVLASGSPRRLDLLGQIGLKPDIVHPTDIDETPTPHELPADLALRLAVEKAKAANAHLRGRPLILAADTVVGCGRRVLPKAASEGEARRFLTLLSGRSHRVWTGVAIAMGDQRWSRSVETRVKFDRLSEDAVEAYLQSGEWRGKAGAYAIQGRAALFVRSIQGSYSNVVGLPLRETAHLLAAAGLPIMAFSGAGSSS